MAESADGGFDVPSPPRAEFLTLTREGHEDVDLALDQVTPTAVARIFSVTKQPIFNTY